MTLRHKFLKQKARRRKFVTAFSKLSYQLRYLQKSSHRKYQELLTYDLNIPCRQHVNKLLYGNELTNYVAPLMLTSACVTRFTVVPFVMRVLMSLGHKKSMLLLGMRSCNGNEKIPKWGIFNASVLLNEHGHPPFYFKIEVLI